MVLPQVNIIIIFIYIQIILKISIYLESNESLNEELIYSINRLFIIHYPLKTRQQRKRL